jgi:site-specific DNA-methyltransferase (adenine-specific)
VTELRTVPLDQLQAHPDNPRLQLREDELERLTAEMKRTGFGAEHAILVRPIPGGLQIVSGHHRVEAARRAGLTEVPTWVRDMDDEEAFMQLVLSNTQGELSPLEIGMHALKGVPLAEGGRGLAGGLTAYAERIGMARSGLSMLRIAAAVAHETRHTCDGFQLADRTRHLYEVSKAPRTVQTTLVAALLKNSWTVAETKAAVEKVREFDIPEQWAAWLPLTKVVEAHLGTREFSPRTVSRLTAAADQTVAWISSNEDDPVNAQAAFTEWLISYKGGKSWEPRAITEYLQTLIAAQQARIAAQFVTEGWHHGNWRDHIDSIDDGTVSLLLTDPPYGQGFQSDYRLDRTKDHKHQRIASDGNATDAESELAAALEAFKAKLTDNAHLLIFCSPAGEPGMRQIIEQAGYTLRGYLIWDKQATGMGDPEKTFAPAHERILHAVKGSPPLYRRAADLLRHKRADSTRHPTEKPVPLLQELIEAATAEGQLVADPFGGVASVAVAAKQAGRRWWSAELEEKYYATGEERLS